MVTSRADSAAAVVLELDAHVSADRQARSNDVRMGRHRAASGAASNGQAQQLCLPRTQLPRKDQPSKVAKVWQAASNHRVLASGDGDTFVDTIQHHRGALTSPGDTCDAIA